MATDTRSAWAEHARAELDRAGHRRGTARTAVIEMLAREPCALTALEIEDGLRTSRRRVSRASIYRILELLVVHGLVTRLDLGGGLARYETIDPRGEHHHHLVCDRCGSLTPFDDRDLELAIRRASERQQGFRVSGHEVALHGACEDCR
jgi:Fur family transcriptional regulator, ferric uptake regulator